jgi:hypothetical protein
MPRRTPLLSRVRSLMQRESARRAAETTVSTTPPPAPREPAARTPDRSDPSLETLEAEARHHRSRLALYRARLYAGKPTSPTRLRELERTSAGADARLRARRRVESDRGAD